MSGHPITAFPTVDANREEDYGTIGMTLRDYFAIHADISHDLEEDGCVRQRLALNLMDTPPPDWGESYGAARVWWSEAEAKLRYMKADAMLKARQS